MNRRDADAARRFAERRRLEDEAPRLNTVVPGLTSLKFEIQEMRSGGRVLDSSHVREIVVSRAPALFVLPCREPSCMEGGHDLTHMVMRALRAGETRFEGTDECLGQIKFRPCGRVLRFIAEAEYAPGVASSSA